MARAGYLTGNQTATAAERGNDFYASPYAALPPLLVAEGKRLPKVIWENAAGNGALVIPLRNRGFEVTASDLNDWGCPDCESQVPVTSAPAQRIADRLSTQHGDGFGIVTNPPFRIIEEFVNRSVAMAPYVAILARLAFLESEGRMTWFREVGLRRVHLISERLPMMHRHGYEGPKLSSAGMAFAWFVFERRERKTNAVPIRWVSWKAACRRYPQTEADTPPTAQSRLPLLEACA